MRSRNNLKLVSFDGGGIRGLSQLQMMRNIIHRLNWDEEEEDETVEDKLPCEHFDLMGGSGTGGMIVIFLTKLRMSVEEAFKEFCTIFEQVYKPSHLNATERTALLRKILEDIMQRKQFPLDLPLTEKKRPKDCAGFVVVSSPTNTKSIISLRTYPVRSQPASTITVVEAILATCATQPDFDQILSGSDFEKRNYIAASRAANPIHEVITEAHLLFDANSKTSSLLSLGVGHPGIISLIHAGDENTLNTTMREMMQDCEGRAQEMEERIGQVGIYSRFSVEQGMQNDQLKQINDMGWIIAQTEDYLNRHDICDKLDLFVQAFKTQVGPISLDQLKRTGGASVPSRLTTIVERSLELQISTQDDTIIAKLKPANLKCGPHVPGCMEGTRRDILATVDAWVADIEAPNILWIKGYPGVGKSAISMTLVEKWRSSKYIMSSSFFRRDQANDMTPNALWRTVAYDLARRHPIIRKYLVTALTADDGLPSILNVDELFQQLIYLPLMATEQASETVAIVVVDALDECGGLDGWKSDNRTGLIRTLKSWSSLPGRFKLVVTSRAEHDIEQLFSTTTHQPLEMFAGQRVNSESTEDIRSFIRHELLQIVARYPSLPSGWPGEETIDKLTKQAGGLFIWIKTLLALLKHGEPQRTLRQLLRPGTGGIASLYAWVLHAHFPKPSDEDLRDFQLVLGAIIFTKYPLAITSLTSLLAMDSSAMEFICNGLYSVLDYKDTVRIHHQSFVDFLVNPEECPQPFCITRTRANEALTKACLRSMNKQLRFNICDLQSSYIRNRDVPNLDVRIKNCIPNDLSYASCYWVEHLVETSLATGTYIEVEYFMNHQFLFWLEILSLLERVNTGSSILRSLASWVRESGQDDSLAVDMQKFMSAFASPISQSVPHIYLSALPFAPRGFGVSRSYVTRYPRTLRIRQGGLQNWPAIQHILSGHTSFVNSVSFSPDGRRIASGSDDHTIRVWDAETGATVVGPLQGHTDSVQSISFSPDGKRIVSGSRDSSLRVWDAETGNMVMGPLNLHYSSVYFVSFSPDGTRIASGSWGDTIRLWDAGTGEAVMRQGHPTSTSSTSISPDGKRIALGSANWTIQVWDIEMQMTVTGPLRGHTGTVSSVSFSPDGRRIASGSDDMAVRLWDAETGEKLTGPLKGHTGRINSLSFSPDGMHIASGSNDNTIRVWDLETGTAVVGPLRGHNARVFSVSFSPDGNRIVSGSWDNSILVWDVQMDKAVTKSLEGHTDSVHSISFSPDGRRIVSCSNDQTIRIWNADTGEMVVGPLQVHDLVWRVSFSPDGRRIVSGSSDGTITVWDAETGESVMGPLKGHDYGVYSVSFSPDSRHIIADFDNSTIGIWDAETGEMVARPLKGHTDTVRSVSFSPDGKRIVSGSVDKSVRVWDAKTSNLVLGPLSAHTDWVNSVAFSPDGRRIVSGSNDRTIRVWDADTGEIVIATLSGHSEGIISISFSPDGRWIVSGSGDKTIRVWDVETGMTVVGPLQGHTKWVSSVTFSPDGRRIVSGSGDHTIRIWDAKTDDTVARLSEVHNNSVNLPSFSQKSGQIISGPRDPSVRLGDMNARPAAAQVCSTFYESSWTEDGWILGLNSELLFWVPPEIRPTLCPMKNTLLIGENPTHLDLTHFVHGDAWTRCKDPV